MTLKRLSTLVLVLSFLTACGRNEERPSPTLGDSSDLGSDSSSERDSEKEKREFTWNTDTCSSWTDSANGNRIEYCIKSTDYFDGAGVPFYALHGMGGNAKGFCEKVTSAKEAYVRTKRISHVICPSFGPHWVIHESGRKESFFRFQREMEKKYQIDPMHQPVLYGESMGGFNVVKLSSELSPNGLQFRKVGVGCPAIFSRRVPRSILSSLPSSLFGSFHPATSVSIIVDSPYFDLGSKVFPELYIMANINDEVGNATLTVSGYRFSTLDGIFKGAKDFHTELQRLNQKSQLKEVPGGHCVGLPVGEMIDFLTRD
jgi:hypothetical protein